MMRVMTLSAIAAALAGVALLTPPAAANEAAGDDTAKLFEAVASYRFGQDEKPLIELAERVRRSYGKPDQRRGVEAGLIKLLTAGTDDCKRFVCRQLWMAASGRSVPALAGLLLDEGLSDAARYALERMAQPAAGKALRDAVAKARGKVRAGIVNSLGHRRDKDAAALLLPLLAEKDRAVADAAAWALGRIGSAEAAKALLAARAKADAKARRVLDDACLLCADTLAAAGQADPAAAVYRQMYAAGEPRRIRIAALRGLMVSQPRQAGALALEAMKSKDGQIAAVAGALLRELPGEGITRALAGELPKRPAAGQVMILSVLARRGDAAARPAVLKVASSPDKAVRTAAIRTLGYVGAAEDVSLLARAACEGAGGVRDAARGSLVRLRGAGVEAAFLARLKDTPPPVKAELVRALSARWADAAVPQIVSLASDADGAVRAAAMAALGKLAGQKELPALLGLLVRAPTEADRAAAGRALAATCARVKDKPAGAAVVLAAMSDAPTPAKCALLALLPKLPAASALAAVRAATKAADAQVRDAAVRALVEWPAADALDDLLAVAADASGTHKVLAVRGCVRVLALPADRDPAKTAALYARVMALARRPEEKKLVLAGLASVGHVQSLKLIEPSLAETALRAEAQAAAIKVALAVAGADYDLATATLAKVAAAPANERIKAQADAAARDVNKHREYILTWMLSGPYTQPGKSGPELFKVAFPPEKPGARDVKWRLVSANAGPSLDLRKLIGGENRSVYLRAVLVSPRRQQAVLELGSDDGVKAWLNGKLIHANNASRSLKPGEDKVKIALKSGENPLMLEIVNGGTDWGACARIIGPDGQRIAGLKVQAR